MVSADHVESAPATSSEPVILDAPLSMEEIEREIRLVTDRMENGVEVVKARYIAFKESDRLLKREKALCYIRHREDGRTIKDAEVLTVVDTDPARAERDQAEVEYWYARDFLRQMQNKLSALQTQSAAIRAMFPAIGRGA